MSWHLILMIVFSISYLVWNIYVYSASLEFNYYTQKHIEYTKWELFWVNTRRRIKEWKFIIKGYWGWYKFKHIWPVVIAWLIYGGIFIW